MTNTPVAKIPDEIIVCQMQSALESNTAEANELFTILYRRHEQRVRLYCLRMLSDGDVTRDIVQETFVRLYNTIADGKSLQNVSGYIIRTARNLCFNLKRDTKHTVCVDEIEIALPVQNGFGHCNHEQKELLEVIGIALDCLEEEYKEAFVLRYYSEMSYEEIAEILGINANNAASRVFRAKQKLKDLLSRYRIDIERMTGT
ncbi:MAG: RNA polymerase sigma factor [Candidatus Kapabacteria bacterium]|jgi:RNA polymerase sigma-70 factor (ECF subfamily)|nr:RNA polymerase sigma factor [Candidatus Kapabacteria bacterium]